MKTKILFPLFFSLVLISSLFFIQNTSAISYYNHIQNPSFLSMSNYIEDGSFESGEYESGLIYGNWSEYGTPMSFSLSNPHTGLYSLYATSETHLECEYFFAEDYNLTLGADIEEFYFYGKSSSGIVKMRVDVFYSDATSDFAEFDPAETTYVKIDVLDADFINVAKFVWKFRLSLISAGNWFIDDIVFMVDDGGGQDSLGQYTIPWYRETKNPLYTVTSIDMDLSLTFGRLDNSSVYSKLYHKAYLRQSINYLDTDYVYFVSIYVYSEYGSDIGIRCIIAYTDGTSSSKIENISADSTWEYINFGKSFINPNKYINKISFDVYSYIPDIVYFDDVGLWASVKFGYTRFGYTLSPYPIVMSYTSFHAYQQVQYTMSCYLYNATGGLNENGTYQFSDNTGFTTGNFTDGIFSYVLTKRVSTQNFKEEITITIILAEEIINFQISATWQYVEAVDVIDVDTTQITNFMFLFIFIFVPSIFLALICNSVGIPMIGFIVGLTIMTSIGKLAGFIPLWFLFVMILVVALLVLAMLKSGGVH